MDRMDSRLKRRVAVGVAGLAVAAGGGIAYAATQTTPEKERKAFLDDAAKRLNTTPGKLEAALAAAAKARIDAAVADGRLTKAQGDEIKPRIDQGGGLPFLGRGGPGFDHHGPGGHRHGGPFGGLDAAAKYLGLTEAKLFAQLRAGKSLADVAKAQNKSVDGLKSALTDEAKARLDQAVKDKRLTQAEADRIQKELAARIDDVVNGKGGKGGPGRPGHGHGGWGPPGPPPGAPDADGTSGAPAASPETSVS
jgi:hypothetical protein